MHERAGLTGLDKAKEADDEVRTRDLQLGKLALYQLSYVRVGLILGWSRGCRGRARSRVRRP
jgi:hypothetical protein